MYREPDWEALGQLQFLLLRRLIEPLNASAAALSLVHLDEAGGKPRTYWQERAAGQVMTVLNLVNAWHALVRFKQGELLPHQHLRPVPIRAVLDWLNDQLEPVIPVTVDADLVLEANQDVLQEALLLLHSAAFTLGPNVYLTPKTADGGVWFRVRYGRADGKPTPADFDALLSQLSGSWRLEDTAFELRIAADFVALSGSKLHFQCADHACEFLFFIPTLGARPAEALQALQAAEPPPIAPLLPEDIPAALLQGAADAADTVALDEDQRQQVEDTLNSIFGKDE